MPDKLPANFIAPPEKYLRDLADANIDFSRRFGPHPEAGTPMIPNS
jgi:hypothetical protein